MAINNLVLVEILSADVCQQQIQNEMSIMKNERHYKFKCLRDWYALAIFIKKTLAHSCRVYSAANKVKRLAMLTVTHQEH